MKTDWCKGSGAKGWRLRNRPGFDRCPRCGAIFQKSTKGRETLPLHREGETEPRIKSNPREGKPPIPAEFTVAYLLGQNTKLRKGQAKGWVAYGLELAPGDLSGTEMCPWRTPGCTAVCLFTAGRGVMRGVSAARMKRTKWLLADRQGFLRRLVWEAESRLRSAKRTGKKLAIRLNVFSDLSWERIPVIRGGVSYPNMMLAFPEVQFFDYTKGITRALKATPALRELSNYHLTFSLAETEKSRQEAARALAAGVGVTAVFSKLPETYLGRPVINGDEDDLRFLDPPGVVIGLRPKGKASKDVSGFKVNPTRKSGAGCTVGPIINPEGHPEGRRIGGYSFGLLWRRGTDKGKGTFKSIEDALAWCDLYNCDWGMVDDGIRAVAFYPEDYKRHQHEWEWDNIENIYHCRLCPKIKLYENPGARDIPQDVIRR